MKVETVKVGMLQTNCYIISINNECIVIDPGDEYEKIKKVIDNKKVLSVIITHYHFDHIGALKNFECNIIDYKYEDGNYIEGPFNFEIIHTPGHKEDLISIYFKKDKIMFTGDFLFKDTIGRIDLKGGNEIEMQKSLKKISKYNDNIIIYPGHGEKTILKQEKEKFKYYLFDNKL